MFCRSLRRTPPCWAKRAASLACSGYKRVPTLLSWSLSSNSTRTHSSRNAPRTILSTSKKNCMTPRVYSSQLFTLLVRNRLCSRSHESCRGFHGTKGPSIFLELEVLASITCSQSESEPYTNQYRSRCMLIGTVTSGSIRKYPIVTSVANAPASSEHLPHRPQKTLASSAQSLPCCSHNSLRPWHYSRAFRTITRMHPHCNCLEPYTRHPSLSTAQSRRTISSHNHNAQSRCIASMQSKQFRMRYRYGSHAQTRLSIKSATPFQ
mmetsp:Transcript_29970/g.62931  ORF Transcript_29970/g.62931 Transcript_29970/m.62931 type:complete len:264 (-) Transcript_29970:72-863(-)